PRTGTGGGRRPGTRSARSWPPPRELHGDLSALARLAGDLGVAAVPAHAADDRLCDAAPVGGHSIGVEALALVAHERAQLLRLDLDVDRHGLGARVAGGVGRRLAGRLDDR